MLDLIRGVAVLGILAINITGFAGPTFAAISPHVPSPELPVDELAFAAGFLALEGEQFSMLFGASLLLFVDRAEVAGRDGLAL